jgi:hypothetical protein
MKDLRNIAILTMSVPLHKNDTHAIDFEIAS